MGHGSENAFLRNRLPPPVLGSNEVSLGAAEFEIMDGEKEAIKNTNNAVINILYN